MIWSDSFARCCAVSALTAVAGAWNPGPSFADGFKIDTWEASFQMLGTAAGTYDACAHRDHLVLFRDLAMELVKGIGGNDQKAAISLEDNARFAYFMAATGPCDIDMAIVGRQDTDTWSETIKKAAAGD